MKTSTGVEFEVRWIDERVYFIVNHPKFEKPVCLRSDGGFVEKNGEIRLKTHFTFRLEWKNVHDFSQTNKVSTVYISVKDEDKKYIQQELDKQEKIIAEEKAAREAIAEKKEKEIADKVGGYFNCFVFASGEYSSNTFIAKCRKPDFETERWNPDTVTAVIIEVIKNFHFSVVQAFAFNREGRKKYIQGNNTVLYEITEQEIEEIKQVEKELADKEQQERAEKKAAKEKRRQAIFAEAAKTRKPVVLHSYTDDCNDPEEECSCDQVVIYANPDGSTTKKRWHTY